jgi:hypothetical protein
MRLIDEKYLQHPFLGSRKMAEMIGRDLDIARFHDSEPSDFTSLSHPLLADHRDALS